MSTRNNIKPEFADWLASFEGCDGGRLDAPVWLCGLEYGGEDYTSDDLSECMRRELQATPPAAYDESKRSKNLEHQYNLKAIKLFMAIKGLTDLTKEKTREFLES